MSEVPIEVGPAVASGEPADADRVHRKKRRNVAIASFSGTLIELYDFQIYGVAAALVFPRLLFPALGTAAGLVASFATLSVAFIARPIGGILFGHFGDRLGRKRTLVLTLLSMGIATIGVGLIPTAAQIGVAAPIIVVVLRFVQGLAAGGEWAGATLFATEHAPKARRGFWAMFPQLGATLAFAVVNLTFLLTGLGMSNETFLSWGWRIPFLASVLLVALGLYVRLKIEETPVFRSAVRQGGPSKVPFVEAFRSQPREIVVAGGVGLMVFSVFYLSASYLTSYGTGVLHLSRTYVLGVGVLGGVVLSAGAVFGAVLSDRVGRRAVLGGANAATVVWALVMFPILGVGSGVAFTIVLSVTMFLAGVAYGPMGAFIPELFQTRYRYTAAGLSYNLSGVVGGAIPPLVAAAITAAFGAFGVGVFLAALCLIATICTFALRETRHSELHEATAV